MKFEHIALMIQNPQEVENFYEEILGLKKEREFKLDGELAGSIFGIPRETSVVQLQNEALMLELFLVPESPEPGFRHTCLSFKNREAIIERVNRMGYRCFRLKRTYSDLVFIRDGSGNIFEIKEEK